MSITPTDISDESSFDSPEAILEGIVGYATTSPENINANVLRDMLYQFGDLLANILKSSTGSDYSDLPSDLPTGPSGGTK